MEFTEKNIEVLKTALMPVIGRFTNDVREINVEYIRHRISIETNNLCMTPCVFAKLYINGNGSADNEGNVFISLSWRWETFSGGSNGTELCRLTLRKSDYSDEYLINEIKLY